MIKTKILILFTNKQTTCSCVGGKSGYEAGQSSYGSLEGQDGFETSGK